MPKETIYENAYSGEAGNRIEPTIYTQVGWSRDGSVQIATVNQLGKLVGPDGKVVEDIGSPGWFMDLNRHKINQLIKILRKARDDAFGRDE